MFFTLLEDKILYKQEIDIDFLIKQLLHHKLISDLLQSFKTTKSVQEKIWKYIRLNKDKKLIEYLKNKTQIQINHSEESLNKSIELNNEDKSNKLKSNKLIDTYQFNTNNKMELINNLYNKDLISEIYYSKIKDWFNNPEKISIYTLNTNSLQILQVNKNFDRKNITLIDMLYILIYQGIITKLSEIFYPNIFKPIYPETLFLSKQEEIVKFFKNTNNKENFINLNKQNQFVDSLNNFLEQIKIELILSEKNITTQITTFLLSSNSLISKEELEKKTTKMLKIKKFILENPMENKIYLENIGISLNKIDWDIFKFQQNIQSVYIKIQKSLKSSK